VKALQRFSFLIILQIKMMILEKTGGGWKDLKICTQTTGQDLHQKILTRILENDVLTLVSKTPMKPLSIKKRRR
jgi:hypothetical protein